MKTYLQDPLEVLDYLYDFAPVLGTDTIASATVTAAPAGLTIAPTGKPTTNTTTTVTAWVAGGTLGVTYTVTFRVVTAGGRTIEQSIRVRSYDK